MATITRKVRVANPRRRRNVARTKNGQFTKRKTARKKTNSPAIHRYSVKSLKTELKRRGVKTRPNAAKRRVRRSNPVLIELGAINPRRKSVASKKRNRRKTRNPRRRRATTVARVRTRRRRTARRRNPTVVRRKTVVYNRRRNRRRNPSAFGRRTLEIGGGVLVGVAATKFLPTLLPPSVTAMTSGMGGFGPVLITGVGAVVAGFAADRFFPGAFAEGVAYGGVAQTISALLNMISPGLAAQLALRGVGDIVPGRYVVPQNPLMLPAPPPMPANGNGMGAAFRPAF